VPFSTTEEFILQASSILAYFRLGQKRPLEHYMQSNITCRTYKIEEAARILRIGRNQAYEAARRGEIPTIKIGKRLLVPCDALDRMLRGEKVA
jgi:excisionase family DNA binding protein